MQPTHLGQILVNFGLVTEAQLEQVLELQQRTVPHKLLGELLLEGGLVDEKALAGILNVQQRKLEFGKEKDAKEAPPSLTPEQRIEQELRGQTLHDYLRFMRKVDATDLHLSAGHRPVVRVHGLLKELPIAPLQPDACGRIVLPRLSTSEQKQLAARRSVDLAVSDPEAGRFRLHVFTHSGGLSAAVRAIAGKAWEFDALGLPQGLAQLCKLEQGLVLLTGAVGSGKSTTLAAMLQVINRQRSVHVVTVEDPIEVVHASERALFSQREVGAHTASFSSALRAALREDPDVIVIGEMRDLEATSIALTAAETGHLVFATMHTGSAQRTIHRILDQFPAHQREHVRAVLANVLRTVICQQLVPTADGRGRALACEVLHVTPAIANLIRDDRTHQIPSLMQMSRREGMVMMDESLQALLATRRITLEEAASRAADPERFLVPA